MSRKARRNKKPSAAAIVLFGVFIAIVAIIFLIIGTGHTYKSSAKNREEIAENVEELNKLAERNPNENKQTEEETTEEPATQAMDMNAEMDKVMAVNMENYDPDALRRWYEGTVIIGDSLTMATSEYGFLGTDVVVAGIGISLEGSDGLLQEAIARYPGIIFLCFGMNDIENYGADYQAYIYQCREKVAYLQSALPGVKIYMHSVLPVDPGSLDYNPWGIYQPEYNAAIQAFCDETEGVTYMDPSFILERDVSLYEPDGIHPVGAFYPKWLTFMADIAGISDR